MKNKLIYTFSILFITFNLITKAQVNFETMSSSLTETGRSQTIKYQFDAQKIKDLKIINQHGYVNISSWNKESIEIEIITRVETRSETFAEEVFDLISFDNRTYSNTLSFKTEFSEDFFSNYPFSINYTIKIPSRLNLNIDNSIGNLKVDSIQGMVKLAHKYGQLELKNLAINKEHKFDLSFVEGEVSSFGKAKINLSNCTLNFNKGEHLSGKTQYCMASIVDIQSVNIETFTDRLTITNSDSIEIKGSQFIGKINNVNSHLFCELERGQLMISASETIKDITISNNYVNTSLNMPRETSYQINGEVTRGNFIHPSSDQLTLIREDEKVNFSGSIGNNINPQANLILFNKDASITIKTN